MTFKGLLQSILSHLVDEWLTVLKLSGVSDLVLGVCIRMRAHTNPPIDILLIKATGLK